MLSVPGILSSDFHTNLAKIPALLNRGVSGVVMQRLDDANWFLKIKGDVTCFL
jgi:hypothetical protein